MFQKKIRPFFIRGWKIEVDWRKACFTFQWFASNIRNSIACEFCKHLVLMKASWLQYDHVPSQHSCWQLILFYINFTMTNSQFLIYNFTAFIKVEINHQGRLYHRMISNKNVWEMLKPVFWSMSNDVYIIRWRSLLKQRVHATHSFNLEFSWTHPLFTSVFVHQCLTETMIRISSQDYTNFPYLALLSSTTRYQWLFCFHFTGEFWSTLEPALWLR